jgi:hypothetical protein
MPSRTERSISYDKTVCCGLYVRWSDGQKWTAVHLKWYVSPMVILISRKYSRKIWKIFTCSNGVHYYHANLQCKITYILSTPKITKSHEFRINLVGHISWQRPHPCYLFSPQTLPKFGLKFWLREAKN